MKFGGILIALAIALSGCSGDPAPKEPQKTTSPTPKSTATPPVMPAQAKEDSPEGAAAFVSYWVKVSNYAAATGDVAELVRLSSSDCSGCQKYIGLYRNTYEDGGFFKGGAWKLGDLKVRSSGVETLLTTNVSFSTSTFKLKASDEERSGPGRSTKLTFALPRSADERQVTQLFLGDVK